MATTVFFKNKHSSSIEMAVIFPTWLFSGISKECAKLGISPATLIKDTMKKRLAQYRPAQTEKGGEE